MPGFLSRVGYGAGLRAPRSTEPTSTAITATTINHHGSAPPWRSARSDQSLHDARRNPPIVADDKVVPEAQNPRRYLIRHPASRSADHNRPRSSTAITLSSTSCRLGRRLGMVDILRSFRAYGRGRETRTRRASRGARIIYASPARTSHNYGRAICRAEAAALCAIRRARRPVRMPSAIERIETSASTKLVTPALGSLPPSCVKPIRPSAPGTRGCPVRRGTLVTAVPGVMVTQ